MFQATPNLRVLQLSYNQLQTLPSSLFQLAQLVELDVSNNQLTQFGVSVLLYLLRFRDNNRVILQLSFASFSPGLSAWEPFHIMICNFHENLLTLTLTLSFQAAFAASQSSSSPHRCSLFILFSVTVYYSMY